MLPIASSLLDKSDTLEKSSGCSCFPTYKFPRKLSSFPSWLTLFPQTNILISLDGELPLASSLLDNNKSETWEKFNLDQEMMLKEIENGNFKENIRI